ncbi:MAG: lytic transglycosylase domain-containing protein [Vicinamibacterales bacterium]
MRILPLALVPVLLLAATPARAQIYSWRDAGGTLVVSDRPQPGSAGVATFDVPGSRGVRATRPLAAGGGTHEFDRLIERHAADQGVPADLVRAVIQVESGFDPRAVSPKGAVGLMQLMPGTARELGVQDPFHPDQNIKGGVTYLRRLLDRYQDDVELALAAYNAGPGSVERYAGVPPYRETRDYVRKVTGAAGDTATPPGAGTIYKWIELIDGRPVPRYSNQPPAGVAYEVVRRR